MDGRIVFLKEQVLGNIQHQWTIEEMAEKIDISASHFQKIFKSEAGMSPIAFLREFRLEKARKLLETTFWRIKQIGVETGLANQGHFTRDFKKKYGLTPSEYRKWYWEKLEAENSDGKK